MNYIRIALFAVLLLALAACGDTATPEATEGKTPVSPAEVTDDTLSTTALKGRTVGPVIGLKGSRIVYTFQAPAGISDLRFETFGGTGDVDLYVKTGELSDGADWDCASFVDGNTESCFFANPSSGLYSIMLYGYQSFYGPSLRVSYDDGN